MHERVRVRGSGTGGGKIFFNNSLKERKSLSFEGKVMSTAMVGDVFTVMRKFDNNWIHYITEMCFTFFHKS